MDETDLKRNLTVPVGTALYNKKEQRWSTTFHGDETDTPSSDRAVRTRDALLADYVRLMLVPMSSMTGHAYTEPTPATIAAIKTSLEECSAFLFLGGATWT